AQPFSNERQKTARSLNKLMLLTATLDEKERGRYREYFSAPGLKFKILDYSNLDRNMQISMSCLSESPSSHKFKSTKLS
ncbi:hypothetical protein PMAYCL1PPCAC_19603, partial [Pristionchus mayeri]